MLSLLREKTPSEADRIFAGILGRAGGLDSIAPNAVSWLSSYLFSPGIYWFVTSGMGGGIVWSDGPGLRPIPISVSAALRAAFYDFAARVIERPTPQDSSILPPRAVITYAEGLHFLIFLLLPHYEAEAPQYVPVLVERQAELQNLVSQRYLKSIGARYSRWIAPADTEVSGQAASLRSAQERDNFYARMAQTMADQGEADRAKEWAEKIDSDALRKATLAEIEVRDARYLLGQGDIEELLEVGHDDHLPAEIQARVLARAAELALKKKDKGLARALITEAGRKTARVDSSSERMTLLALIARAAISIDPPQAWDLFKQALSLLRDRGKRDPAWFLSAGIFSQMSAVLISLSKLDWERAQELTASVEPVAVRLRFQIDSAGAAIGSGLHKQAFEDSRAPRKEHARP